MPPSCVPSSRQQSASRSRFLPLPFLSIASLDVLSSSALPTPVQGLATGAREALHPSLCAPHRTVRLGLVRRSNNQFTQNSNPLCPGCVSRLSQRRCYTMVQPMARASSPLVKLGQHSTETGQLWSQSPLFAMCVPLAPGLSILLDNIPSPPPPPSLSQHPLLA